MSKSIINNDCECYLCMRYGIHNRTNLEKHHIFFESNQRSKSEKWGCWVYLCHTHHQGNGNVIRHNPTPGNDLLLKRIAQERFEEQYGHEKFMEAFHKNYL